MKTIKVRNITIGEGIPKIIVPLVENSQSKLIEECERVIDLRPDIIEWRVDTFDLCEDLEAVQRVLELIRSKIGDVPLLFTFRTVKEGGIKEVSLHGYKQLLTTAIQSKQVDVVDIEFAIDKETVEELVAHAREFGVYVVLSNHDFQKTPNKGEIIDRFRKMQELGADIPKIAVMSHSIHDVMALLDAAQALKDRYLERPFIAISMGKIGVITRLAGEVFGSAATFASGQNESAPGQIPISEVRSVLSTIHKYSN